MEKINKIENINMSKLEKPSSLYKDSFIEAMKEFLNEEPNPDIVEGKLTEQDIKNFQEKFEEYLLKLNNQEKGINLKDGYVPATTLWIVNNNEYIGRVSIRHELNEKLLKIGGNIGCAIRPTKRSMGYGTKAFGLGLEKAKELGLKKVLVTCDDTNVRSWKMIEKNNGILQDKITINDKLERRYWIEIK